MTVMGFINSVAVLILPFLVKFLAPDNTPAQWSTIFYVLSVVIFIALMIFNLTCKAEPREWAYAKHSGPVDNLTDKNERAIDI